MSLPINPETQVGALLEAYPGIDDALMGWLPAFAKLQNPVLRKTVTKVATLDQAARIGGISTPELVRKLRELTGQPAALPVMSAHGGGCAHHDHSHVSVDIPKERPAWLVESAITHSVDADAMLQLGEHPIGKIRQLTAALEPGGIVRLTSSFLPAPLIDTLAHAGFAVFTEQREPGKDASYFCRLGGPQPERNENGR